MEKYKVELSILAEFPDKVIAPDFCPYKSKITISLGNDYYVVEGVICQLCQQCEFIPKKVKE